MNCAACPRRDRQRADAAFERGNPLLEGGGGRVHDPGVDVAEALQGEELGGVVGVLEDVGRGLIDRHRARAGGRVGPLPGVDREGVEAEDVVLPSSLDRRRGRSVQRSWCEAPSGHGRHASAYAGAVEPVHRSIVRVRRCRSLGPECRLHLRRLAQRRRDDTVALGPRGQPLQAIVGASATNRISVRIR